MVKELELEHFSVRLRRDQKEWLRKQGNASETIRAAIDTYREQTDAEAQEPDVLWLRERMKVLEDKIDNLLSDKLYTYAKQNLEAKPSPVSTMRRDETGNVTYQVVNTYMVTDLDTFKRIKLKETSEEFKALHGRSERIVNAFAAEIQKWKQQKRGLEEKLYHIKQ